MFSITISRKLPENSINKITSINGLVQWKMFSISVADKRLYTKLKNTHSVKTFPWRNVLEILKKNIPAEK